MRLAPLMNNVVARGLIAGFRGTFIRTREQRIVPNPSHAVEALTLLASCRLVFSQFAARRS
jgi:hypothetical protein